MSNYKEKKLMWVLLAGNLLSLLSYSVYFSYLSDVNSLSKTEKLLGWFLIEHVFEEYKTTSGKLFLVYDDFRELITNLLSISRNVFFIAQYFTPVEFILLNIFLFFIIFIYRKKLTLSYIQILIFSIYFVVLNSFLFINLNTINYVFVFYLFTVIINFYLSIIYYYFFFNISHLKPYKIYLKLIIVKLFLYFYLFLCFLLFITILLSLFIKVNENFVQEFVLQNLIIYLYFYYS